MCKLFMISPQPQEVVLGSPPLASLSSCPHLDYHRKTENTHTHTIHSPCLHLLEQPHVGHNKAQERDTAGAEYQLPDSSLAT